MPGLTPTTAQVAAEAELLQRDKDGVEIDQGIFLAHVLANQTTGLHLCHAMLLPRPSSADFLQELDARGRLDLGKVSYIDSSGLGVLVGLYSTATKVGGGIKLANLNPGLEDILQITKVFTVFEVFERAEDAAAAFNRLAGQSAPEEW